MTSILLIYIGVLLILYILSTGKYTVMLSQLDQKKVPLKKLMPVGLYLLEFAKCSFQTSYDRRLLAAITELYGPENAFVRLQAHWGNKITLMLLSLLFTLFIGLFTTPDAGYFLFCAILPTAVAILGDRDLFDKVKKRRMAIQVDFPDFVNKLTLLINAGMTVSRAWEKATVESAKNTSLYFELNRMQQDIRAGIPEHKAYEEFAKRCRIPVITRFISVILQNIRKGNAELVPILRVFAAECWELRKNTARKYGEEASTRMLLPMMLMFIAILLIVGMPAVLALKGI